MPGTARDDLAWLLPRLAGRLPDDDLAVVRSMAADGEEPESLALLTDVALDLRIPLTDGEVAALAAAGAAHGLDPELPPRIRRVAALPGCPYEFVPPPGGHVAPALVAAAATVAGVRRLWRTHRHSPVGAGGVWLAELEPGADVVELTAELQHAFACAGEIPPRVEVLASGPTPYHRAALAGAVLVRGPGAVPPAPDPVPRAGFRPPPGGGPVEFVEAVATVPGLRALWRVHRDAASGPEALWIAETDPAADTGPLGAALLAAGEPEPRVHAFAAGDEPSPDARAALAAAVLAWHRDDLALPRVARSPGGASAGGAPFTGPEREAVLALLRGAPLLLDTGETIPDPLEAGRPVPVRFHADGAWVWDAAIAHHLEHHGVAPDPELTAHLRAAEFPAALTPAQAHQAFAALDALGG